MSPTVTSKARPPRSAPRAIAAIAPSQSNPCGSHRNSGEKRSSASRTLSAARSSTASNAIRSVAASSTNAPCARANRDSTSSSEPMGCNTCACSESSTSVACGRGCPASRYRSSIVDKRIAPSRCRCRSTLAMALRSTALSIACGATEGVRMLLEGKKVLVTGVLTRESIAYAAARALQEQGAEIVLTSFGRAMGLTEKSARRLPDPVDVLEMDANDPAHIESVSAEIGSRWGRLDGFLHAIAFAIQTSAYSLRAIAAGMLPHMREHGGAIVSLDFDARVAWPIYDWMGVAKASLESVTRYLARDLGSHGIRVNTLSAGPLRTIAGKGIPGFQALADGWGDRARLGGDHRGA